MVDNKLKKSLMGYNKNDVHAYLTKLNEDVEAKINEKIVEINEIKKEVVLKATTIEKLNNENENLKATNSVEIGVREKVIKDLSQTVEDIKKENVTLKTNLEKLERERTSVSEALIAAQREASSIIERVKEEAKEKEEILRMVIDENKKEAERKLEELKSQITKSADELMALREGAISAIQKYKSELEYLISEYKV